MKPRRLVPLFLCLFLCACASQSQAPVAKEEKTGIAIEVVDGFTEEALENATVIIPEFGLELSTNHRGHTGAATFSFAPATLSGQNAPWQEVTVLAYAPGYASYALFHYALKPNEIRHLQVLLFKGETDIVLSEGPDAQWVNTLISTYQPEEQKP